MQVALSVVGRFHTLELATQLHQRGHLAGIFCGYPHSKLRDVKLPAGMVHTFPWVRVPYMALSATGWFQHAQLGWLDHFCNVTLDRHVAHHLPECDVFVGLAGSGLRTARQIHVRGARYVCDTGSSHIRHQNALLEEEHARWQVGNERAHPRVIAQTEAEYEEADLITVPSRFSARSFIQQGIDPKKVHVLPYGVSLQHFRPTVQPASDSFDVLFAGGACLRKGVPYLLQAFQKLRHPRKRLRFAGYFPAELAQQMRHHGLWSDDIELLGHLDTAQLAERMSRSHVLVLPSIEDGFGLVMAQAMACGCPVVASEHTGASELFEDGEAGRILPVRRVDLLADALQQLADEPDARQRMSRKALARVQELGGWQEYGQRAVQAYSHLVEGKA